MLTLPPDELQRWIVELEEARKFRDEQFGTYRRDGTTTQGVGQNLDLFEYGDAVSGEEERAPVNLAFVLEKNIVPLLLPQNPQVLGLPIRRQDSASAPIAAKILNHYLELLKLKATDRQAVFDAWVLGYGVVKTGYYSPSGVDTEPSPKEQKKRLREKLKDKVEEVLVSIGVPAPKPPEEEASEPVVTDSAFATVGTPYSRWVDPFGFLMDPRARSIYDAFWVSEETRETLHSVKETTSYSRDRFKLVAAPVEGRELPESQLDRFQVVEKSEIHYKNPDAPNGITILILGQARGQWVVLYHEHSVYRRMKGWQYSLLAFNKHQHKLYPISDLSQVRPLIRRFNDTFESILEQVDKFVAKILVNTAIVQAEGQNQLKTGEIGALVKCEGMDKEANLGNAAQVLSMNQVSQDLVILVEKILDLIVLVTGLTKAELTGITTASTATEAQIGQGGTRNRRFEQSDLTLEWVQEHVEKLWAVITQFVDLEELELLIGEPQYADESGMPNYSFAEPISPEQSELLQHGEFRFNIEVTSMQRPNVEILRKQVENLIVVLLNQGIHQQLALQGKMVDVAEGLRIALKLYPELIADVNRIIRPLSPPVAQSYLGGAPGQPGQPGQPGAPGAAETMRQAPAPNYADLASSAAGEKGMGSPGA